MTSFVEGRPEGLEVDLAEYRPGNSNISKTELWKRVTGSITYPASEFVFYMDGKPPEAVAVGASRNAYFFFPRTEKSIELRIGEGMYVPLEPGKFMFPYNQMVNINPKKVRGLRFTREARQIYDEILRCEEANLNDLLEAVGYIVNSSMKYDFDKINPGRTPEKAKKWAEIQQSYQPKGNETMKGICVNAGMMIRDILDSMGLEDRIGILSDGPSSDLTSHDITVIFDKETGYWGVINSKSPTKEFNLAVTKEQLHRLGGQYVLSKAGTELPRENLEDPLVGELTREFFEKVKA
jgi:hypothetical protein